MNATSLVRDAISTRRFGAEQSRWPKLFCVVSAASIGVGVGTALLADSAAFVVVLCLAAIPFILWASNRLPSIAACARAYLEVFTAVSQRV